jgi:hypothetical protein
MSTLGPPVDLSRPLFAYGLLKPGELAFSLLEPFLCSRDQARARGTLWLRDGIPLLDPDTDGQVGGWLLWFDPARLGEAWEAVCSFEPAKQYRWAVVQAHWGAERTDANVLVGRRIRAGSAGENVQQWSAARDPVFAEGLDEVERLAEEAAPDGSVRPQPDTPELWSSFFRLQAAYLLLWSIIERYTALRFGPGLEPWARVKQLGEDTSFLKAVADAGIEPGVVVDSRDPGRRHQLAADGTGAAEYFYQVRSNLSHRGKSAFQDAQLVHKAVTELRRAMRILLDQQLPAVESGNRDPAMARSTAAGEVARIKPP